MKQIQVEIDGETVEATKPDPVGTAWQIGFPFGDRRFYGTEPEVRTFIKREMKDHKKGVDDTN